jgi:adenylylsulfate kinase-like enzyme
MSGLFCFRPFRERHQKWNTEDKIMVNERDANGPYRKALAAVITAFTGVSDLYESPAKPAVEPQADRESVEESVEHVLALLRERGAEA